MVITNPSAAEGGSGIPKNNNNNYDNNYDNFGGSEEQYTNYHHHHHWSPATMDAYSHKSTAYHIHPPSQHEIHLMGDLRRQVEYYFSPYNFFKDTYLQQYAASCGGAVPMSVITGFPKLRELLASAIVPYNTVMSPQDEIYMVANALQGSQVVGLSPDALWIYPLQQQQHHHHQQQQQPSSTPDNDNTNTNANGHIAGTATPDTVASSSSEDTESTSTNSMERTTIIVRDMPVDAVPTEVLAAFSTDTMTPTSAKPEIGNTWYVTFNSEAEAVEALKASQSHQVAGNVIKARITNERQLSSPASELTNPVHHSQYQQQHQHYYYPQHQQHHQQHEQKPVSPTRFGTNHGSFAGHPQSPQYQQQIYAATMSDQQGAPMQHLSYSVQQQARPGMMFPNPTSSMAQAQYGHHGNASGSYSQGYDHFSRYGHHGMPMDRYPQVIATYPDPYQQYLASQKKNRKMFDKTGKTTGQQQQQQKQQQKQEEQQQQQKQQHEQQHQNQNGKKTSKVRRKSKAKQREAEMSASDSLASSGSSRGERRSDHQGSFTEQILSPLVQNEAREQPSPTNIVAVQPKGKNSGDKTNAKKSGKKTATKESDKKTGIITETAHTSATKEAPKESTKETIIVNEDVKTNTVKESNHKAGAKESGPKASTIKENAQAGTDKDSVKPVDAEEANKTNDANANYCAGNDTVKCNDQAKSDSRDSIVISNGDGSKDVTKTDGSSSNHPTMCNETAEAGADDSDASTEKSMDKSSAANAANITDSAAGVSSVDKPNAKKRKSKNNKKKQEAPEMLSEKNFPSLSGTPASRDKPSKPAPKKSNYAAALLKPKKPVTETIVSTTNVNDETPKSGGTDETLEANIERLSLKPYNNDETVCYFFTDITQRHPAS